MGKADLLVFGSLALADGVLPDAFVAVVGEKVAAIGSRENAPDSVERLDVAGGIILPGVIDGHVHSLGSPKEGFLNSTAAAVAGGVTTIVDMPSDLAWPSPDLDLRATPEAVQRKVEMGESQTVCDFALWGAATPDTLPEIERMADSGVVGFKMFMCDSRRIGRMDDGALLEAFERINRMDLMAAVHAENAEITRHLAAKFRAAGRWDPIDHNISRPAVAELEAVSRALDFAAATGVQLDLLHVSLPEAVRLARRRASDRVLRIAVETCPHYLLLSEDTVRQIGNIAKVIPPMRSSEECERMWELVKAGWVDTIGSDHSGYDISTKMAPCVFDNQSGFAGVQTLLPLMFSEGVVKRDLSLEGLVSMLSTNPARRLGLYPRKGTLLPGSDADLVVLDPRATWKIAGAELRQAAGWTPYEGWEVTGRPVATVSRGEIVYRAGDVLARPGRGRFLPARKVAERRAAFARIRPIDQR